MLTCDNPPLEHYDYDELEEEGSRCGCPLCVNYWDLLAEQNFYSAVCAKHKHDCRCKSCMERNASHVSYMAALSKRDTYSELSFIISRRMEETKHTHVTGPEFLRWVYSRMADRGWKTEGWWAITSANISLQEWIDQWQVQCLPERMWGVSGLY